MINRYRNCIWLLITLTASAVAAPAWAQQGDQQIDAPPPDSPAVSALMEANLNTPAELVRTADILFNLQRPDLARQLLQRAIKAKPNQQQLADMADELGSAMFLEMASREELRPEASQLADAVLAAINRRLQDIQYIKKQIKQLQDPSVELRSAALARLKEGRTAAVGPLICVLADPGRAEEHPNVRYALVQMGRSAVDPLLGVLEKADPRLMVEAIRVLGQMQALKAKYYLLGPYASQQSDPEIRAVAGAALMRLVGRTPSESEALHLLTERAKDYFDRQRPLPGVIDGRIELWRWDEARKQCISKSYTAGDAAMATAARFARDAYALAGDDPEIRMLYLTAMLEWEMYENGLDKPWKAGKRAGAQEAAGLGTKVVEDLLEYAIAGGHTAAATAAARILGRSDAAGKLLRQGAAPAALVRATRHPDRRLRMAATDAVIRLQPIRPFPGSSYVTQSLGFFAASGGVRRALVASPNTKVARRLSSRLAAMGYDVDVAVTGRGLSRLAQASPDYELALIDASIDRPQINLLLQQLRHDCRSADLRVGLIARSGHLERAKQVAARDPMAMAFSQPHSDEAFAWQMKRLATLSPREFVPHAQRQLQAARALDRLVELSTSSSKLYDVREAEKLVLAALYNPKLSTKVVAVLASLDGTESQRALVELASRHTQPIKLRKAAAMAFLNHTQKYGILLTTDEIDRQYDRYNKSKDMDVSTQRVLGAILDCIEAPTQTAEALKTKKKP